MGTFLVVLHIFTCVILVFVVLIQSGKEGGIGVMGGGGASQTVFGSSGGANFFTKFTSATAGIFMLTSIGLTVVKSGNKGSIFEKAVPAATIPAPAAPAAPGAGDAAKPAAPAQQQPATPAEPQKR